MKLAGNGFNKFHCGWCDQTRGGVWNTSIGYRCTNRGCGFLFCDECARSVGVFGGLLGNCACPRCGNPAAQAVNGRATDDVDDDGEEEALVLPNGWPADDAAYRIVQAIHARQNWQAGDSLRKIMSAISEAQYRRIWSVMPSMGSPHALWETAMQLFAAIEQRNHEAESEFLEMLRAIARSK